MLHHESFDSGEIVRESEVVQPDAAVRHGIFDWFRSNSVVALVLGGSLVLNPAKAHADDKDSVVTKKVCDELAVEKCPKGFYMAHEDSTVVAPEDSTITPNQAAINLAKEKAKALKRRAELREVKSYLDQALARKMPWAADAKARFDSEIKSIDSILAAKAEAGKDFFGDISNKQLRDKVCKKLNCGDFVAMPDVAKEVTTATGAWHLLYDKKDEQKNALRELQELKPWINESLKRKLNWAPHAEATWKDKVRYYQAFLSRDVSESALGSEVGGDLVNRCRLHVGKSYKDQMLNGPGKSPAWFGYTFKINADKDKNYSVAINDTYGFDHLPRAEALVHMNASYHGCGFYQRQDLEEENTKYFRDNYKIAMKVLETPPESSQSKMKPKIRLDKFEVENKNGYGAYLLPGGFRLQMDAIAGQMNQYPAFILDHNPLKTIYVVDEISDESGKHEVHGRAGGSTMILVQGSEGSFHHEYFHILDGTDGISGDNGTWTALNADGAKSYPFGSGDEAVMHDYKCDGKEDYKGFADCYGKFGGPDEDQATIAGALFSTEDIRELMLRTIKDPVLLKKIKVLTGCEIDQATGTFSGMLTLEEYRALSGFKGFEYYPKWTLDKDKTVVFDFGHWNSILKPDDEYAKKYQDALKKKNEPNKSEQHNAGYCGG